MPLELVESIPALRDRLAESRRRGSLIGFVPTMGALHDGHARLIERARAECGTVVVSIFVNPLQFDRADDLNRYPRPLEADLAICSRLGCDLVFHPGVREMYPSPQSLIIQAGPLGKYLCGQHRQGHFDGVATVVMKLLQIAQADRAYFGEKDAQQLAIIRRLVDEFNVPVEIVGVPTVREADGLALSSRNQHLRPDQRALAPFLYRALREASHLIGAGIADPAAVTAGARALIPSNEALRVEYLEVVGPKDMAPVARIEGPVLVAAAMWIGGTRLIDNLLCRPPGRDRGRDTQE